MTFAAVQIVPPNISVTPACCIDLGFSELDASMGLYFREGFDVEPGEVIFAEGAKRTNIWLEKVAARNYGECVLVVEAPLSMALSQNGNPCHRHIELQRNYEKCGGPRSLKGWYYQAGANLSLGSVVLLRKLAIPSKLTVMLIEGFFCSIDPDEAHATHLRVAQDLLVRLDQMRGQQLVSPRPESQGGTLHILPGLEELVKEIPGILLRDGLQLKH